VAVFEVDRALLHEMAAASAKNEDMTKYKGRSTLRLIQSIKTLPKAFPTDMNTCGRICVHRSGRFVVVSNRGHQSIAIFRVLNKGPKRGELCAVGYFHTRGETPRHFQFDASGQYLLVANQDSDSIAVFNFNLSSGEIKYTGNEYRVPSPNFVCCCPTHQDDVDDDVPADPPVSTVQVSNLGVVKNEVPTDKEYLPSISSDNSCTVPTDVVAEKTAEQTLLEELERARQEIAQLKAQLSTASSK